MQVTHRYAATCAKGVEHLLAAELASLGADDVRESRAAVTFAGPLKTGYRACLWSRLASRVLLLVAEFPAASAEALYAGVAAVPWEDHLSADGTLAVDATGASAGLTNTMFVARTVKDAVVDRLRERFGRRPSVALERPDVRLNLRLRAERATLSLDLSGEPLHRRGYRAPGEQVAAPLKENLAAALLVRAGWPEIARDGGALADPMCGSGTLLIEGALIAAGQAPGLLRDRWGFLGWLGHDTESWDALLAEADELAEDGRAALPPVFGADADPRAVELALACAKRAGLGGTVRVETAALGSFAPAAGAKAGLVITNPPYGVRLDDRADLAALYALIGERLVGAFEDWRAAVFTAEPELARATGLRSRFAHTFYNGAIPAKLYVFDVGAASRRADVRPAAPAPSPGAEMLANRLVKNARHLGKWARREQVTCFRVYDADLPEYALAIDLYEGAGPDEGRRLAHVQEYAPPPSIEPAVAERRLAEALAVVPGSLGIAAADIALKVRRRQRGARQYERLAERGEFVTVAEGGLRFLVNVHDYLDTGLFLDHRDTRARIRALAEGRRFLNLFAYTGAATVYAAAGGARSTTTVDLSATYLEWAKRNLEANGIVTGARDALVRADALAWVGEERERVERGDAKRYGLVFLDPPTFSNSKRMGERTFDVQRDHAALLREAAFLLEPDGVLLFSTNARRFGLDADALGDLDITDITAETIPPDFARNPRIHRTFEVRRPS